MNKNKKKYFRLFLISLFFIGATIFVGSSLYAQTDSPSPHERSQPSTGPASEVNSRGGNLSTRSESRPDHLSHRQKHSKNKKSSRNNNHGFINDENGSYQE